MYVITNEIESKIEIEKSKFITYLFPVYNEIDAKSIIANINDLHPNATHVCYAYIFGNNDEYSKANDDGEPSGTAGIPILECLKMNNMSNIIALVVRYFGGIKLGGGGLIRAYSKSVANALSTSDKYKPIIKKCYNVQFSYDLIRKIDYHLNTNNILILNKDYSDIVTYKIVTYEDELNIFFSEISSGNITPIYIEDFTVLEKI